MLLKKGKPIRFTTVGMNERMQNTLRLFFKGPCSNRCVLVDENSAEACIIDLDCYRGQEICEEYQKRHPGQPCILFSLQQTEGHDGIFLRKPLERESVLAALDEIGNQIQKRQKSESVPTPVKAEHGEPPLQAVTRQPVAKQSQKIANSGTHNAAMSLDKSEIRSFIGTAPDIKPTDTAQVAKAQYNPYSFLQGHLQRAILKADSNNCSVDLKTPRGLITIPPNTHYALVEPNDNQLRTLSSMPVFEGSITLTLVDQNCDSSASQQIYTNIEDLLWKVTLWSARGRVPAGTDLTAPIYLKRWPNMTRLKIFPHALRIAALWTQQPHSLADTARLLDIPQRYVFSFFSATNVLGLAVTSQRATDSSAQSEPVKQHRERGFLGRILAGLRRRSSEEEASE